MSFSLLPRDKMGRLRHGKLSTIVASGQLERQGWDRLRSLSQKNLQLCFTWWNTVSTECLHFSPLLP